MAQSQALQDQITALRTSIQNMVQSIVDANANAATAENALKLEGYSYQDIVDNIMGATALTVADVAAQLNAHTTDTENPHGVTKEQVGLALVENLPLAVKANLEGMDAATIDSTNDRYVTPQTSYYLATKAIEEIAGAAPETLDTINEIAQALNNNPNVINNILTELGTKATTQALTDAIDGLTKADVGLDLVDNFATATTVQAQDASNTDLFMTPATTHAVVEDAVGLMATALTEEFDSGATAISGGGV